jgi:hypothetical protein
LNLFLFFCFLIFCFFLSFLSFDHNILIRMADSTNLDARVKAIASKITKWSRTVQTFKEKVEREDGSFRDGCAIYRMPGHLNATEQADIRRFIKLNMPTTGKHVSIHLQKDCDIDGGSEYYTQIVLDLTTNYDDE